MTVKTYKSDGALGNEIKLPEIFDEKPNSHLLYEAVKCFLANQRQGTSKTKGRDEVSGGGIKPWRQKGTGRARSGSNTSPVWKRGGKAHGPDPRDYRTAFNKKARRKALVMAISSKVQGGEIKILESLEISEPKTKNICTLLNNIGSSVNVKNLLVLDGINNKILLAGRNVKDLNIKQLKELNAYDIISCKELIITKDSLLKIAEVKA